MTRADVLTVQRGLAPTRSAAARLIAQGALRWRCGGAWTVARKAGEPLADDATLEVTDDAEIRFVSRGGLKLDAAIAHCGIDVTGLTCLDVGQGTGGFTDVLLQRGAAHVVGVEVGHSQVNPRIAGDPRVTLLEGVNARHLEAAQLPYPTFDLIVGDLSFISLALVLPALVPLMSGNLLLLVKPQFELQPVDIGKGGLVKSPAAYGHVEAKLRKACATHGLVVRDWFASVVEGGDGNREFFLRGARESFDGISGRRVAGEKDLP